MTNWPDYIRAFSGLIQGIVGNLEYQDAILLRSLEKHMVMVGEKALLREEKKLLAWTGWMHWQFISLD